MRIRLLSASTLMFVWLAFSCQNESEFQNDLNSEIKKSFNDVSEKVSKTIPTGFQVNWNSYSAGYSDDLKSEYFEFEIIKSKENEICQNRPSSNKFLTTYKILATRSGSLYDFYTVKYFQEPSSNPVILNISDPVNFTGKIYLIDTDNNILSIKKYINGEFRAYVNQISAEEYQQQLESGRLTLGCYTETTYHYVDWYQFVDGVWTYLNSDLTGVTYENICDEGSGSLDPGPDPGSGEGTYSGTGGGPYRECNGDRNCIYEILNGDIQEKIDAWEEQIDDSLLKPCVKIILSDIKNLSQGSMAQIIQKFSGSIPGYNWVVKDGVLNTGENANTSQAYNKTTGTVTTTFDAGKFENSTDLSITRTILHESVHAYVIAAYCNTISDSAQRKALLGNDWAGALLNYGHDYITNNYLTSIADALQQYGISKGYSLSRQFYEDLAWGGLTHSPMIDSNGNIMKDGDGKTIYEESTLFKALSPDARKRINDVIKVEQSGKDYDGNTKMQNGRNAGC